MAKKVSEVNVILKFGKKYFQGKKAKKEKTDLMELRGKKVSKVKIIWKFSKKYF